MSPSGGPHVERVRIICLDEAGRVLLMKWHDSVSGRRFWEPPGGGIEAGETPLVAAVRELKEETGYEVSLGEPGAYVARDYWWLGRHFVHIEAFFIALVGAERSTGQLTAEERATLVEMRFVAPDDLVGLDAPLEPPNLPAILGEMTESAGLGR